jgi:hypothetical protein
VFIVQGLFATVAEMLCATLLSIYGFSCSPIWLLASNRVSTRLVFVKGRISSSPEAQIVSDFS